MSWKLEIISPGQYFKTGFTSAKIFKDKHLKTEMKKG